MDSKEFREFAYAAVDFVADYMDNIRDRNVLPSVEPGYLQKLLPTEVPEKAEKWKDILADVESKILPGMTHWQSPNFHAYFPTAMSYPALVGEIIAGGFGIVGFSWIASPACTELEVIMMDWVGKMINLPEVFLNSGEGYGGGILQSSASESTFVALLASKEKAVYRLRQEDPSRTEADIKSKLIAYSSDQSNSSVEKSGLLGSVPMRLLPTDENCSLRAETLLEAIEKDIQNGLIPCCVIATIGTTGTCAVDDIEGIGKICNEYNIWLHIDAAYAGAALVCPEYRYMMKGVELANSFNFNLHKWLLVNFDCSPMWVRDGNDLADAFSVDRIYLKHHHNENPQAPDYRHWQIALGRRFKALKVWFTLRSYGIEGLQKHIRTQVSMAGLFADCVRNDDRFEVIPEPSLGLVCFRLKGPDERSKELLKRLTERKKIYCIPATYHGLYIIRYAVCGKDTNETDIKFSWDEISSQADEMIAQLEDCKENKYIKDIKPITNTIESLNGRTQTKTQ